MMWHLRHGIYLTTYRWLENKAAPMARLWEGNERFVGLPDWKNAFRLTSKMDGAQYERFAA